MRHDRWIHTAFRLSKNSSVRQYRMCAILVKGGRIIKIGLNRNVPALAKTDYYPDYCQVHAETDCLIGVEKSTLEGATLYIAGRTRSNGPLLSKPCRHCQRFLLQFPLKAVFFQTASGKSEPYYAETSLMSNLAQQSKNAGSVAV